MEKIATITDPSFRTGEGAKGPWTLMKVTTESGKQGTVFAPCAVGDAVTAEYNEQYKSYSFKVVKAAQMQNIIAEEKREDQLTQINTKLDQVLSLLEHQTTGYEAAKATAESLKPKPEEEPLPEFDGDFDAAEIPF